MVIFEKKLLMGVVFKLRYFIRGNLQSDLFHFLIYSWNINKIQVKEWTFKIKVHVEVYF